MKIGKKKIGINYPTFFIADIAANHDGEIERAKELIFLAKKSGADCAKFQHFLAPKIVSDKGFSSPDMNLSHQSKWKDSVFNIYKKYHTPRSWTKELISTCNKANIEFMTTPYDVEAVNMFKNIVNCYKIGSGDITYKEILLAIRNTSKPTILATGAANLDDVKRAMNIIYSKKNEVCLMQCNTNYTNSEENFKFQNLNVLSTYKKIWPKVILGLSDHTPGHSCVLGAIAMGARVIEKHFTDDNKRVGPDHDFAMNPDTWKEMILRARELELSLGNAEKRVEKNEIETVIIQRRSIRLNKNLQKNSIISEKDLSTLRPCPSGSINPMEIEKVIGKKLKIDKKEGEALYWKDLG